MKIRLKAAKLLLMNCLRISYKYLAQRMNYMDSKAKDQSLIIKI